MQEICTCTCGWLSDWVGQLVSDAFIYLSVSPVYYFVICWKISIFVELLWCAVSYLYRYFCSTREYNCCCYLGKADCQGEVTTGIMLLFRSVFLLFCLFACLSVCINLTMTARKYDCCCCLPKGDCHGKVTTGIVLLFSSVILLFRLAVCFFVCLNLTTTACLPARPVCLYNRLSIFPPTLIYISTYAIQPIHVLLQDCNNIVAQSQLILLWN